MENKRDLLIQLVISSFKLRYQNSILGFIWVLIKPYALFLVIYFVISAIRADTVDNFGLYLLSGLIFFTYNSGNDYSWSDGSVGQSECYFEG